MSHTSLLQSEATIWWHLEVSLTPSALFTLPETQANKGPQGLPRMLALRSSQQLSGQMWYHILLGNVLLPECYWLGCHSELVGAFHNSPIAGNRHGFQSQYYAHFLRRKCSCFSSWWSCDVLADVDSLRNFPWHVCKPGR